MLAAALLLADSATAAPSMVVSSEQLAGALEICRIQSAQTSYDGGPLVKQGWPEVMSQGPDDKGYNLKVYRHPTTMLMIALIVDPARSDECIVTVPTGPEISPASSSGLADKIFGKRRAADSWSIDAANIRLLPMGGNPSPGMRFVFAKKEPQ